MLPRVTRLWQLALVAIGAGAASACERKEAEVYPAAACFSTIPPLDILRTLAFDSVFGAADRQAVDFIGHALGRGYTSSIEPQVNAWSPSLYAALMKQQGCIIARLETRQQVPGAPFLGARRAYWWIQGHPDNDTGQAVFIPDDSTITHRHTTIVLFRKHRGHRWTQSISRFKAGSVYGWSVCGDMCCETRF